MSQGNDEEQVEGVLDGMRKNFYEIINWWEVDVHDGLQYNRKNKQ